MNRKRELWVDYAKTFACILVVLGHLLQGLNKANIEWNNILYKYIDNFIYIFHMPLFMCLSGYLYKKYTIINSKKEYIQFVKKKLINLGIPYIVFYLVYVLINMLFASSVNSKKGINDILNIFTKHIPPFWFLYALFFIFLIIPILEKIFKENKKIIMVIAIVLHITNIYVKTNIYVIDIVSQYLVYFYFGAILIDGIKESYKNRNVLISAIFFVLLGLTYCYILQNKIIDNSNIALFNFLLAIWGIVINIQIFKNSVETIKQYKVINKISKYTFPIYLMHTIFSAGIRIVLLKIGINNFYIQFIFGFIFGIICPIIVAKILENLKYGNIILYPTKTLKELRNNYENCNDRA